MSPDDTRHLQTLLRNFGADALGEGDPVAGANLLAAMAISLANVQRPGSGLATWDGQSIAVGASVLISGSQSTSLISERVLNGLAARQNNLIARLSQRERNVGVGSSGSCQPCVPGTVNNWAESALGRLCQPGAIADEEADEQWGLLVQIPVRVGLDDLHARPMIYLTGAKPAELSARFALCNCGRPFLHVGIDGPADFAQYQHQVPAIMDGRMAVGPMESIRGEVVVTDPGGMLCQAVRDELPSARWTSRMIWLVDGIDGPWLGEADGTEPAVALGGVPKRYESAMRLAWGQRINTRVSGPVMLDCKYTESQARWMGFLKGMERDFPGIAGIARSLCASLQFGLLQMIAAADPRKGFRMPVEQVEAFAKVLVHRMVNARAAMLATAEFTRRRQLSMYIVKKLAGGPLGLRELCRKFYRLPQATCHELLLDLEAEGKVSNCGGLWGLTRSAILTVPTDGNLVLEA